MLVDQARSVIQAAEDDGGDREWKVGRILLHLTRAVVVVQEEVDEDE